MALRAVVIGAIGLLAGVPMFRLKAGARWSRGRRQLNRYKQGRPYRWSRNLLYVCVIVIAAS